jgi:hypothetical protein
LVLGENLDTERIEASYDAGVLTLRIPVAEKAKPRKISVSASASDEHRSTISGGAGVIEHDPSTRTGDTAGGDAGGLGNRIPERKLANA